MARSRETSDGVRRTAKPPLVQRGDSGTWVTRMQRHLKRHGYSVSCCGAFGPVTEVALRAFQHQHRLRVSGVADELTWALLIGN